MNGLIYNTDCMDLMKTLPNGIADLVLTDIPYGEVNRAIESGLRKLKKDSADETTFQLDAFLGEVERICKGSFVIFCGMEQISTIRRFFRERDMLTRVLVYNKTNPSPIKCQHAYLSDCEFAVYAKKKSATFNGKYKSCVFEETSGSSKIHPTQKPLRLFRRIIKDLTNEGDTVVDPCAGVMTTAVACEMEKRKYICCEINKEFYLKGEDRVKKECYQQKINL
jgi:site-specific DNA-methyltransferase (adenine-specific)